MGCSGVGWSGVGCSGVGCSGVESLVEWAVVVLEYN